MDELFFIVKGSIEIGFEINRKPKYVIRLGPGGVIGIYNITYNKKTMFNYRVKHEYFGYTIRKDNWQSLMRNPEYTEITDFVKNRVQAEFETEIKFKCLTVYRKYIYKLRNRQDKNEILTVINVHNNEHLLMHTEFERNPEICHSCSHPAPNPLEKFD